MCAHTHKPCVPIHTSHVCPYTQAMCAHTHKPCVPIHTSHVYPYTRTHTHKPSCTHVHSRKSHLHSSKCDVHSRKCENVLNQENLTRSWRKKLNMYMHLFVNAHVFDEWMHMCAFKTFFSRHFRIFLIYTCTLVHSFKLVRLYMYLTYACEHVSVLCMCVRICVIYIHV